MIKYYPDLIFVNIDGVIHDSIISKSCISRIKKILDKATKNSLLVLFSKDNSFLTNDTELGIKTKKCLRDTGITDFSWIVSCNNDNAQECILKYINNKTYSRFIIIDKYMHNNKFTDEKLKNKCLKLDLQSDNDIYASTCIINGETPIEVESEKNYLYF